jgi:glycosyltransferase involved in cell wall biosynthesis
MKVLQFVTRLDLGGAQETCLQQCRVLAERGHEVHLLTGEGGELMCDAGRVPGLAVRVWRDWEHPIRPLRDLRCLLRLARVLREERFDVLHTHCSKAGMVGRFAAILAGAPPRVFHHVHGWSFNATQPAALRAAFAFLERISSRSRVHLLACSEATAAAGRERAIGGGRLVVLHYGIDRGPNLRRRDRAAIRRRLGLAGNDVLFLQLGNLKPQKDPLTFARAAVLAGRRLRRAQFWIAGDGPLRGDAERTARDGGLGRRFRILGWRRDVPELLAAADVVVLTSRFEGLPLAVLRGMAAARPVVATAVDGTPEAIVHGRTGILVRPGDEASVAEAMVRLGKNPALRCRMGIRGRRLSRRFDLSVARRALIEIYARDGIRSGTVGLAARPH